MLNFQQGAGAETGFDLIPKGFLGWFIIHVKNPQKLSQNGGQYVECELTVDDGQQFARRKIFTNIMDPYFEGNSEKARQMGMAQICRILETARGAGPNNPAAYQLTDYTQLNGLRIGAMVGIDEGKNGYQDKNSIAEYATPNPDSKRGKKIHDRLIAGENGLPAQAAGPAASAPSGFGNAQQAQAAAPQQSGGWGSPAPSAAAPQAAGAATPVQAQPSPQAAPQGAEPASGPGWLRDAQSGTASADDEVPY